MTDGNQYYLDKREAEQEEHDFKDESEEIAEDNVRLEARVEELEAKLAIALCAGMEKAAVICESKFQSRNTVYEKSRRDAALEIRTTLAELKGGQDE